MQEDAAVPKKVVQENVIVPKKVMIALAVYLTALFSANTLGLKIMPFLFGSHLSVGVFSFPIVFLMTDVVGEVYGKKTAKMFVLAGFVSTVLFLMFSFISLAMPWSAEGAWVQESYDNVFGISMRVAIASLTAFAVGQYQDVLSFFFFRAKTGKRFFWLRSTLSNIWSQFWDTVLFMLIAFVGVYSNEALFSMIITWWLYKVLMGIFFTPLSYAGLWILKDKKVK